jgi:hypothetical protein
MKRHFEFVSNIEAHKINDAILLEVECSKVGDRFCDNMGVTGFPTIMLLHKGKAMKYPSARTHGAMVQFLSDKSKWVMENLPPKIAEIALALEVTPTGDDEEKETGDDEEKETGDDDDDDDDDEDNKDEDAVDTPLTVDEKRPLPAVAASVVHEHEDL